jgi:hypothetical protein
MSPEQVSAGEETPPTESGRTLGPIMPDFFQDEDEPALRSQVEWVEQHFGMTDRFYAKFLRIPEASLQAWRRQQEALPPDRQEALRDFWRTVLHLLSFAGMDEQQVRILLGHQALVEASGPRRHPLAPPWTGSCLKSYLEEGGANVLPDVDRWVTGFRFSNPYAS